MHNSICLLLLLITLHYGMTQQVNSFEKFDIQEVDSVEVAVRITKEDTFQIDKGSTFQVYSLRITNRSDSAICFLNASICRPEAFRSDLIILQLSNDCGASDNYYCLEHCLGWDSPYDPIRGSPSLIPPRRTLRTKIAIPLSTDRTEQFHLHFTAIDTSQFDVVKAYKEDKRDWTRNLKFKCNRNFWPK
jgi:hypothetical protein